MTPQEAPALLDPALADSIRATLSEIYVRPEFDWETPPDLFGWLSQLIASVNSWLQALEVEHPVAYWLLVAGLAGLLLLILAHLSTTVVRVLRYKERPEAESALRVTAQRDVRWHLDRVAQLKLEGRYGEALAHRFVAVLLELERRKALEFHPSKTPAEYRSEVQLDPAGQSVFADLVTKLYRHLFGGAPCGPEDLEVFERAARAIGGHVAAN